MPGHPRLRRASAATAGRGTPTSSASRSAGCGEVEQRVDLGHPLRERRRRPSPAQADRGEQPVEVVVGQGGRVEGAHELRDPGVDRDRARPATAAATAPRQRRQELLDVRRGGRAEREVDGRRAARGRRAAAGRTSRPPVISSAIVKTSHDPSVSSATSVESGGATTRSAGMLEQPGDQPVDPVEHLRGAASGTRRRRSCSRPPTPPASGPPDLVDCIVELSIV